MDPGIVKGLNKTVDQKASKTFCMLQQIYSKHWKTAVSRMMGKAKARKHFVEKCI
jgi:hypothetical protein